MTNAARAAEFPKAEAVDLLEAVSYVDGATVSRVIAKTDAGNLTLFAFDAGQELSEHSAPYDAFVHVLEGEVTLTIAGKPVRAAAGQMVVMPANIPHALNATSKLKMLLSMFKA